MKSLNSILPYILALYGISLYGQNKLSKWNFAYQYNPQSYIKSKYLLIAKKDSFVVYLNIQFNPKDRRIKNLITKDIWLFDYTIKSSYEARNSLDEGEYYCKRIILNTDEYFFTLSFKKPSASSAYLFLLLFSDEKDVHILDIPLKIIDYELYKKYYLCENTSGLPIFSNFIHKKDTFSIFSFSEENLVPVHYYNFKFAIANPPMAGDAAYDFEIRLKPDTSYAIDKTGYLFDFKKGVYVLGSTMQEYQSYLVVENKYPRVSKIKELVEPTVYIAADDERKALKYAQKPKQKLDDFWLDMIEDKEKARKSIKKYYRRIEEANVLFTCHKEGWKTDMGMIYTIFGPPDEVLKSDTKELWTYSKKHEIDAVRFLFERKRNSFGAYYFELIHNPKYAEIWFSTIEMWRKGYIE